MTKEQIGQALSLLREREDRDLAALYFDKREQSIPLPPAGPAVVVRKAVRPGLLPGALRIPSGAQVYFGTLPGSDPGEENAAGWASVSPARSGFRTVTAETLPAFRKRGVASACLLQLLAQEEGPFLYLVRRQNTASVRLACRCGFLPVPPEG